MIRVIGCLFLSLVGYGCATSNFEARTDTSKKMETISNNSDLSQKKNWTKDCQTIENTLACSVTSSISNAQKHTIAMLMIANDKNSYPKVGIMVPANVDSVLGLNFRVDKKQAVSIGYDLCNEEYCGVVFPLTQSLKQKMKKGQEISVSVFVKGSQLDLIFSLTGFLAEAEAIGL